MKKSEIALIFCSLPLLCSCQFIGMPDENVAVPTGIEFDVERVRGPTQKQP